MAGEYNGGPSGATSGDYDVNGLYVEFNVPLMRDGWLGKSLDLSLAERYSDYSTFGGESPGKIGLRWQVADELLLRGSFAAGFRAPSISELYGPLSRFDTTRGEPLHGAGSPLPASLAPGGDSKSAGQGK